MCQKFLWSSSEGIETSTSCLEVLSAIHCTTMTCIRTHFLLTFSPFHQTQLSCILNPILGLLFLSELCGTAVLMEWINVIFFSTLWDKNLLRELPCIQIEVFWFWPSFCTQKNFSSAAGFEPPTSGLEVQPAIHCATRTLIWERFLLIFYFIKDFYFVFSFLF